MTQYTIQSAGEFELYDGPKPNLDLVQQLRTAGFVRVYHPNSIINSTPYEYILEHDLTVYCRVHKYI
jgi:hypothetical protein